MALESIQSPCLPLIVHFSCASQARHPRPEPNAIQSVFDRL
jgi:hypothetical protein